MLRACVLDEKRNWSETQPLIEFSYNNCYHSSIGMVPYEALYGRKNRSRLCWFELGEKALLGPEMVRETSEKIRNIWERLRIAQCRQKSYVDQMQKPLEFEEGEHVFLNATSTTRVGRAIRARKLQSRFIGPF
jgi:hypothetical protein